MVSIKWCLNTKNGIEIIDPNDNLANAYLMKAEESLELMQSTQYKDWKISMAYYSMYYSLYAILMKLGVKCEIHACTIEFMKEFLNNYFNEDECKFIFKTMSARIDAQYYVNREVEDKFYSEIINKPVEFIVKCKSVILKLNEAEINEIRDKLEEMIKK